MDYKKIQAYDGGEIIQTNKGYAFKENDVISKEYPTLAELVQGESKGDIKAEDTKVEDKKSSKKKK